MLKLANVRYNIGETAILNGVTLRVREGETVGMIGPNGSGKTTLFNCINGFCLPNAGTISYQGRDITHLRAYSRSRLGLGRVFQTFGIFKEMTVMENMITAIESRQSIWRNFLPWMGQNAINEGKALELLKEVKLESKLFDKAGSLSGGQQRLLEIIRTLAFGADLFLLDEPTAGVAPRMKEDVAHLIKKLQEMNKTIMVIEHDINFIQKFCSRIVVLDVGRIVLDDTPEGVRGNELLKEIYFGKEEENNKDNQAHNPS